MTMPKTNVQQDYPDARDWIYRPGLFRLKPRTPLLTDVEVLNQRNEGACTGFALAAAINLLNRDAGEETLVSERMLYEMAKRHDEWAGEDYEGSSLRGAIQGFRNMGVCERDEWPFLTSPGKAGELTIDRAKSARNTTLGAYYRLRPVVSDYHAALMETGVIVASARCHPGWDRAAGGVINADKKSDTAGGHAFAIIGYSEHGFWVQNSWGKDWGDRGLALWRYEDWIDNVMDAWVFQLALPTPEIFGKRPLSSKLAGYNDAAQQSASKGRSTLRDEIAGHFVHIDDGEFQPKGRYWSTPFDVQQTAELVGKSDEYKHLLIYGHGGLNSPKDSAARIAAMKEVYKENGIYPYHIMYDTGILEELKDLICRKSTDAAAMVGGIGDWRDKTVEHIVRRPGTALWEEMKRDAKKAFDKKGAGTRSIKFFIDELRKAPDSHKKKVHLLGHSTGAVLFAHLLSAFKNYEFEFDTCALLAPACTVDLYDNTYLRILEQQHRLRVGDMKVLNLKDALEKDDTVGSSLIYGKSLLYLVSNAFEREKKRPLLGMEKFSKKLDPTEFPPDIVYSNGVTGSKTRSKSHGGFDNDVTTMNYLLKTVLGRNPERPFRPEDLDY
jgi:Papain family cysteine protease